MRQKHLLRNRLTFCGISQNKISSEFLAGEIKNVTCIKCLRGIILNAEEEIRAAKTAIRENRILPMLKKVQK